MSEATPTVALPAELTIFTAAETREALLAAAADAARRDAPLHVDAAEVIDVDGAGVQLLVSLSRLCERERLAWTLGSPGDALVQACRVLGLSHWLERHAAIPEEAR